MEKKNCDCGTPLPTHLFALGLAAHTCSCERHWVLTKAGKLVQEGTAPNPFIHLTRVKVVLPLKHEFRPHPDTGIRGLVMTHQCTHCKISDESESVDLECPVRLRQALNDALDE